MIFLSANSAANSPASATSGRLSISVSRLAGNFCGVRRLASINKTLARASCAKVAAKFDAVVDTPLPVFAPTNARTFMPFSEYLDQSFAFSTSYCSGAKAGRANFFCCRRTSRWASIAISSFACPSFEFVSSRARSGNLMCTSLRRSDSRSRIARIDRRMTLSRFRVNAGLITGPCSIERSISNGGIDRRGARFNSDM